jgi:carboxypeptidase Q
MVRNNKGMRNPEVNQMKRNYLRRLLLGTVGAVVVSGPAIADDVDALVAAMLGDTPIIDDLHSLTDSIGGRVTGSPSNSAAVAWALERFKQADVPATAEEFQMPSQWQELEASARVSGDVSFAARVVAKPFSTEADDSTSAPLVDVRLGTADDFDRLAEKVQKAWVLVETPVLNDDIGLAGLFSEYGGAAVTARLAIDAGAAGIVFMSSRPKNLLYRLPMLSAKDELPILLMERESAERALRLLRGGKSLTLQATIKIDGGYAYQSSNVIGEIRGSSRPDEIVLMGAHLDSHDLGTGALDNGANVTMLIDIARQIRRLGLQPERTIRFALWNGEEQGLFGSWHYTERHEDELDNHIMATSFDIGTGRITGFFTGGRARMPAIVDQQLAPIAALGPFQQVDIPLVGTDNFDFMIEGVPNLIAAQADANYASNYHAASDTFDKVDQQQLKLNSAIAAALAWGFANSESRLPRQTRDEIQALINATDLEPQMRNFGVWEDWASGIRGRHPSSEMDEIHSAAAVIPAAAVQPDTPPPETAVSPSAAVAASILLDDDPLAEDAPVANNAVAADENYGLKEPRLPTEANTLQVTVTSVRKNLSNKFVFETEAGQVWLQVDQRRIRYEDTPFEAKIRPASMGSFFLKPDSNSVSVRVRREK